MSEDCTPCGLDTGVLADPVFSSSGQVRYIQVNQRLPDEVRARLLGPDCPLSGDLAEALADEIAPEDP